MADIQKRSAAGGVRWDVRYRDESRRQRKKSFERKVDAQRFAASVETDLIRGDWIDPDRGRELFSEWADDGSPRSSTGSRRHGELRVDRP